MSTSVIKSPQDIDIHEHVMFQCPENNDLRVRLWEEVAHNCPPALLQELQSMTVDRRTTFMLVGFRIFVMEWTPLYAAVANYFYTLYMDSIKN